MRPRSPHERGRAASSLELFFDLVFVVAVSTAAADLHGALAEGHIGAGLGSYVFVFFSIWWAWMNFTWFATSFDTDDWLYRVLTIGQMAGVMVLTVGIGAVFGTSHNLTIVVIGYVIMRIFMVLQWLRAARSSGVEGRAARWYAGGIAIVQVAWIASLLIPAGIAQTVTFALLVGAEICVPIIAENHGRTPWHPEHLADRFGAFTLIVLGESLLASTSALIEANRASAAFDQLMPLALMALLITAAMWWIYFWPEPHRSITSLRSSLRFGYGHYFVFAAAGAVSVGVELSVDLTVGKTVLSPHAVGLAVAVPIAVFVVAVWLTTYPRSADRIVHTAMPLAAILVLLAPLVAPPVWTSAIVLVALVVVLAVRRPLPDPQMAST